MYLDNVCPVTRRPSLDTGVHGRKELRKYRENDYSRCRIATGRIIVGRYVCIRDTDTNNEMNTTVARARVSLITAIE